MLKVVEICPTFINVTLEGNIQMQYICLLYDEERPTENMEEVMQAYGVFNQEVVAAGVLVGGEPLQPPNTATCVKVRDAKTITTDGPFAESKEQLGGYYLLECANLDEAVKWAAKIPVALNGMVEVRPLMILPDGRPTGD